MAPEAKGTNINAQNFPILADPASKILNYLGSMGFQVSHEELYSAADYPAMSDIEALKHYFYGLGGPFVDFLVWVDIGVGFKLTPKFSNEEEGQRVKEELEEFYKSIDFLGTLIQFATYYYSLGRAIIVFTKTLSGENFYTNRYIGLTGIDCVDPTTLDEESIKKALSDPFGTTPFKQRKVDVDYSALDMDRINNEDQTKDYVTLERDRVIYRTRNPLSRVSTTGFSIYQNCVRDLQTGAKFPRYRNQLSTKYANLHRHYIVNTEMLKNIEGGLDILQTKEQQDEYLLSIWNMIKTQQEQGATIITFDFIESRDISFGGKEPDLGGIEKQTLEAIGFKTGVPINLMMFGPDMNRATLDTMAQFFVDRRKNGPQEVFKDVIRECNEMYLDMKNINGSFEIEILPFLNESKDAIYSRAVALRQAEIPMSNLEKRREVNLPDTVEYGDDEDLEVLDANPDIEKSPEKDAGSVRSSLSLADEEGDITFRKLDEIYKDLKPWVEYGEGKPSSKELDYRTELLVGLTIAAQTIRQALKDSYQPNIRKQSIDHAIEGALKSQLRNLDAHLLESRARGLSQANADLKSSPLPYGKKIIPDKARYSLLLEQQRENIQDIKTELRSRIRKEITTGQIKKTPDAEVRGNIEKHIRRAAWRLDLTGVYGYNKAQNDAYLDTLKKYDENLFVDILDRGDKRVCKKCILYARGGPYKVTDVEDIPLHVGCRCRYNLSKGNWENG